MSAQFQHLPINKKKPANISVSRLALQKLEENKALKVTNDELIIRNTQWKFYTIGIVGLWLLTIAYHFFS